MAHCARHTVCGAWCADRGASVFNRKRCTAISTPCATRSAPRTVCLFMCAKTGAHRQAHGAPRTMCHAHKQAHTDTGQQLTQPASSASTARPASPTSSARQPSQAAEPASQLSQPAQPSSLASYPASQHS